MNVSSSHEFSDLVAIVTGGASGIGEAIAERLSQSGAKIAIFDVNQDSIADLPSHYFGVRCDVSDDTSVTDAIQATVEHFGRIDIVINNAGIGAQGTIETNTDEQWHQVYDINVLGMVRVSRAALPYLRKSPAAAIVNTCSVAAIVGLPERALYSATKGAVHSLTLAMAADHIREGIRVNGVNPGTAETPWIKGLMAKANDPEAELKALAARQPHGRLVQAEEVADAVAYLASPKSQSTTGTFITVDGGMQTLRLRNP